MRPQLNGRRSISASRTARADRPPCLTGSSLGTSKSMTTRPAVGYFVRSRDSSGRLGLADQLEGQILQAGIVTDKQKSFNVGCCFSDDCEDRIGGRFIDARLAPVMEVSCERPTHEIPGFLGAARRRDNGEVRGKPFSCHVLAYPVTCLASGSRKRPLVVRHAGGAIGLGVSEKHQSSHRRTPAPSRWRCDRILSRR